MRFAVFARAATRVAVGSSAVAFALAGVVSAAAPAVPSPPRLRVATYNVENYMLVTTGTRAPKSEAARAKITEVLRTTQADVIALQELGGRAALEDIRQRATKSGLAFPHAEFLQGHDAEIQVGLLSRFPVTACHHHTNDTYLLAGRRFRVSRGFLEADIRVRPDYELTVFVAHLKSRRASIQADESDMRLAEARFLREKIDARLRRTPNANLMVLGDLNDTKDTESIRTLIGRGRHQLVDTRPAESNGDTGFTPNPRWEPRTVTWTHYYGKEDSYSRIDYILVHPNAAREWLAKESRIVLVPDWGLASDHRPLLITLDPRDQ